MALVLATSSFNIKSLHCIGLLHQIARAATHKRENLTASASGCNKGLILWKSFCQDHSRFKKPKQPLSTFFMYIKSVESELLNNHPGAARKDLVKLAAIQWKSISPSEKSKFEIEYAESKKIYHKKMDEYLQMMEDNPEFKPEFESQPSKTKLKSKTSIAKELNKARLLAGAPKRPLSGFFIYLAEQRLKNVTSAGEGEGEGKRVTTETKAYGLEWAKIDDADKMVYTKIYKENRAVYRVQMDQWKVRMVEEGRAEELNIDLEE